MTPVAGEVVAGGLVVEAGEHLDHLDRGEMLDPDRGVLADLLAELERRCELLHAVDPDERTIAANDPRRSDAEKRESFELGRVDDQVRDVVRRELDLGFGPEDAEVEAPARQSEPCLPEALLAVT